MEIKYWIEYWLKPQTFNCKDELVINRLRIEHIKMSHGYDLTLFLTCGESFTVKYSLFIVKTT